MLAWRRMSVRCQVGQEKGLPRAMRKLSEVIAIFISFIVMMIEGRIYMSKLMKSFNAYSLGQYTVKRADSDSAGLG